MKFVPIRVGSIALAGLGCFLIDRLAHQSQNELILRLFCLAGLFVTLAVSLNLINGITGQFSIGHAAFYQVGAYSAGFLALNHSAALGGKGVPLVLALLIFGALFAAVAGLVVGLPSLRLKGDYLAIVTLGFGEIIRIVVQNTESLGGAYGMKIPQTHKFAWLIWLLAIVCIAVCRNLLKTAHGLQFLAVREDEVASSAMGVNVTGIKVVAFVIGSAFAGAAGALYSQFEGFITPNGFTMDVSFIILTMVVLGGTGSITGSALAGGLLFYLPEKLRDAPPVHGNGLVAAVICVVIAVVVLKRIIDHYHGGSKGKAIRIVGAILGAAALQFIFSKILGSVPSLAGVEFKADNLRMVIFAATLVILMMLRPQGIFAHHELSWDWLRRLFTHRKEQAA